VIIVLLMHRSFEGSALKGGTVIFRKSDNYVIFSPNNSPKINNSRIA